MRFLKGRGLLTVRRASATMLIRRHETQTWPRGDVAAPQTAQLMLLSTL